MGWKRCFICVLINLLSLGITFQNMVCSSGCSMWSWEECVFCDIWMKCPIYVFIKSNLMYCFTEDCCLLVASYLDGLSIDVSGVLKSCTITVLLSVSFCRSVNCLNVFWCSCVICIYIINCYTFLMNCPLYHHILSIFVSHYPFGVCFVCCLLGMSSSFLSLWAYVCL